MKRNKVLTYLLVFGGVFFLTPSVFADMVCDKDTHDVLHVVALIVNVIKFVVPLIIVALAVVDVFKVVTNGKDAEGERKKAFTTLATRFVLGVLIFFIPQIAKIIFNAVLPGEGATIAINCMLEKCGNGTTPYSDATPCTN